MSSLSAVWSEIKKHKSFLITTHYNPDADAACSSLAMASVLKKMGKKITVVNQDDLPQWLTFLPGAKNFKRKSKIKKPSFDAVIILDCGERARIGSVEQFIGDQRIINIDHHITNDHFGSVNLIISKSSSTCEIVFDLLKEAKVKLNKELAVLLYSGIMTDTGCFRFENTRSKTLATASQLMELGVSASDLYQHLYKGVPAKDIRNFVDVIHGADLLFNDRVYCVLLPKKVMDGFSKGFDLKENILAFLRSVEGIELVVILSELTPTQTRVNLRSQNNYDVAKLASQFNGGGHIRAAGAKIETGLEPAKKKMLAAIKKSL